MYLRAFFFFPFFSRISSLQQNLYFTRHAYTQCTSNLWPSVWMLLTLFIHYQTRAGSSKIKAVFYECFQKHYPQLHNYLWHLLGDLCYKTVGAVDLHTTITLVFPHFQLATANFSSSRGGHYPCFWSQAMSSSCWEGRGGRWRCPTPRVCVCTATFGMCLCVQERGRNGLNVRLQASCWPPAVLGRIVPL